MIRIITNNFWIKLVCVLIATGVWVYVANSESKVDSFPGSIPVEIKNKPEELVVIKDVESVELRIIAERGDWKKISADTFDAYIDLAGLEEGTHEISVKVNSQIEGIQIVEINPAKIMVRLEPLVTKVVSVSVRTEGSAADGFVPAEATVKPEKVSISGAASIIGKINEAIAIVKLNGESEPIKDKFVSLVCYNEKNQTIKDIEFNPSQVKVDLQIVRASQTKTVGIKAKTTGSPQNGYWVSQITTDPTTLVITGSTRSLSRTEYLETEAIDVAGLSSNKITTVNLVLPTGISLVSGQKTQLTVKIEISINSSQKEISGQYNYQNLADNLKIANIEPINVKVLLSGSVDKLNQLTANDVVVNIDLAGQGSGIISKDISYRAISVPSDISVVNVIPSAVKITLENK